MKKVRIINDSKWPLPKYQTEGSAAVDLHANIVDSETLKPMQRKLIPTGIKIALPTGYEAQVRPRSGLAHKFGISIVNSPGTIDSDYRGDIGINLINLGDKDFVINPGDRIAQMVLSKFERFDWDEVETIDKTKRGEGRHGSTGTNDSVQIA